MVESLAKERGGIHDIPTPGFLAAIFQEVEVPR
jgi:hypothetical protein